MIRKSSSNCRWLKSRNTSEPPTTIKLPRVPFRSRSACSWTCVKILTRVGWTTKLSQSDHKKVMLGPMFCTLRFQAQHLMLLSKKILHSTIQHLLSLSNFPPHIGLTSLWIRVTKWCKVLLTKWWVEEWEAVKELLPATCFIELWYKGILTIISNASKVLYRMHLH